MYMLRRPSGYSKIEMEDPEDIIHRRAQYLIYKVLQQADCKRKPLSIRVRICRLKIKIGRRLKKIRKSIVFRLPLTKVGFYRQLHSQFKAFKRLFGGGDTTIVSLPLLA